MSPTTIEARTLSPASQLAASNTVHFPNESAEYRTARNALLAEEIELRRYLERVAAQRRALPPGGEIPRDFEFVGEAGLLRFSGLFGALHCMELAALEAICRKLTTFSSN